MYLIQYMYVYDSIMHKDFLPFKFFGRSKRDSWVSNKQNTTNKTQHSEWNAAVHIPAIIKADADGA